MRIDGAFEVALRLLLRNLKNQRMLLREIITRFVSNQLFQGNKLVVSKISGVNATVRMFLFVLYNDAHYVCLTKNKAILYKQTKDYNKDDIDNLKFWI